MAKGTGSAGGGQRPGFRGIATMLLSVVVVGLLCGVVISLFRMSTDFLAGAMSELYGRLRLPIGAAALFAGMCGLGLLCGLLVRVDPQIASSGIPLVSKQLAGRAESNWKTVLPLKFAACAITLGSGLTMGREGPSVQIGGAVGQGVARVGKRSPAQEGDLLGAGAAAGIASAFSAPVSGALFAMEVLYGRFAKKPLALCLLASAVAGLTTACFFGFQPLVLFADVAQVDLRWYAALAVMGVVMGLSGALFSEVLLRARDWRARMDAAHDVPWWVWSIVPFAVTALACLAEPALFGSGQAMVFYAQDVQAGPALGTLVAFYFAKLALLAVCFGCGVPGGCIQPLLGIGALAGNIAAQTAALGGILPVGLAAPFALAAMAGQFASAVQAPLTAIVLILEITQQPSLALPCALVAAIAYATAKLLHAKPLYGDC